MPFLLPNQQRQSTEGNINILLLCVCWQDTGARVDVFPMCCPQSTDRVVRVCGMPVNVARCMFGLHTLLQQVTSSLGRRHGIVVSGVRRMNEVNARRARLLPGWVTVFGRVYHLGM